MKYSTNNHTLSPFDIRVMLLAMLIWVFVVQIVESKDGVQRKRIDLRVMALNVWGMPNVEDKQLRIKVLLILIIILILILILILISSQAIGNLIAKSEFDVYLLSELWMRPDHATIEALLPVVVFLIDMITVHYIHCNVHQLSFHAKLKMRIRATG